MYSKAAASMATAAAPMEMPAIAPAARLEWLFDAGAVTVAVATGATAVADIKDWVDEVEVVASDPGTEVVNGSSDSDGHGSPGCSMKDEFAANSFCISRGVVAFGLMTPTI
jgi:hypothetical protein